MKKWKRILTAALAGVMILGGSALLASASEGSQDQVREQLFDMQFYLNANPDLLAIYGRDEDALYAHFVRCGANEGRAASALFDVNEYKRTYPELAELYGDDNMKYYEHYLTNGAAEGRESGGLFDAGAYARAYPDLKEAYGYNLKALYQHFLSTGIYESRLKGLNFNSTCYGTLNPELGRSYSEHPELLYMQYLDEGMARGLKGAKPDIRYQELYCNEHGHVIKGWSVTKTPSCTEKGRDAGTCQVCGRVISESIKETGHSAGKTVMIVKATAEHGGYVRSKCEKCGEEFTSERLPKLGG